MTGGEGQPFWRSPTMAICLRNFPCGRGRCYPAMIADQPLAAPASVPVALRYVGSNPVPECKSGYVARPAALEVMGEAIVAVNR